MGHYINFDYFVKVNILLSPAGDLIKRDYIYLQLIFISTHAHLNVIVILYQQYVIC